MIRYLAAIEVKASFRPILRIDNSKRLIAHTPLRLSMGREAGDAIRTRDIHLGKVTLYQ